MNITELLTIYFERSTAVQTFWNLYIAVSIGLLAFISAAQDAMEHIPIKVILSVAFLLFALSNLRALVEVQQQRHALARLADAKVTEETRDVVKFMHPPPLYLIVGFHLLMDIAVVVAVWVVGISGSGDILSYPC